MRRFPVTSRRLASSLSACFVTTLACPGHAEPAPNASAYQESVTVTGTYRREHDLRLPFAVSQVGIADMQDGQPNINLSEALQFVPGVLVKNRQNYAQDLQISVRGFGSRAAFGIRGIKLLIDGIPASTPDGQGQAATFNLDVADRIEVLRGPMAVLYGTNAGGVIQMFTRSGSGNPSVAVRQGWGSDGLDKWQATGEGASSSAGFLFNVSSMQTDGYRDHSAARRNQYFGKIHVEPTDNSELALSYIGLDQGNTQDPGGQTWDAYREDPRSVATNVLKYNTRKSIHHQQLGLNYQYAGDYSTWQFTAYVGNRTIEQFLSIPKMAPPNVVGSGGVVAFDRAFTGFDMRQLLTLPRTLDQMHLTWGVAYDRSSDDRQGYQNFIGDDLGVKGALRRDEQDTIASLQPYLQGDWSQGPWLITAGIRDSETRLHVTDRYLVNGDDSGHSSQHALTGSAGVSYSITPMTTTYINIGRGVESPTFTEMSYAIPPADGFNRDLKPGFSTQYEAGLKTVVQPWARLDLAVFDIATHNEIVVASSQDGRTSYRNAGATRRRGVEFSGQFTLDACWQAVLSYTYLDARYTQHFTEGGDSIPSGNHLPGVPEHALAAKLMWTPTDTLTTAVEGVGQSSVAVNDSNSGQAAPGYTTVNWYAQSHQTLGNWRFRQTLRVDNIFDHPYVGSVIVNESNSRYYEAAPGRTWYADISATYQFD